MKYARVVELVDSLDSGSSAHSGRGGSTPPSRTMIKKDFRLEVLFCITGKAQKRAEKNRIKAKD